MALPQSPQFKEEVLRQLSSARSRPDITDVEVIRLVAEGKSVKDIAAHFKASKKTIASRQAVIKKKFRVYSLPHLVAVAKDLKII